MHFQRLWLPMAMYAMHAMYASMSYAAAAAEFDHPGALARSTVLADLTHDIVTHYRIVCKSIFHRPRDVARLSLTFLWHKHRNGLRRRPMGSSSLEEHGKQNVNVGIAHRCANILMSGEYTAQEFAQFSRKNSFQTGLWIIFFLPGGSKTYFEHAHLPFSTEVLAVEIGTNVSSAVIYEASRVDLDHPVRIAFMGTWSSETRLRMTRTALYQRRSDLEGKKLQVGIILNWPISYPAEPGVGFEWDGLFPTIWREVEEAINATTEYIRGSSTGSLRQDGSWTGLIGLAARGEIDVIVSELTMNSKRKDVLDFTRPIITTKNQIYFKEQEKLLNWMAILQPFPQPLWHAILGWMLVCAVCMALCYYLCARVGLEERPYPPLGSLQFFFWVLQSMSNQGLDVVPRSSACRIIVLASYLVSAVVIPSYSASLISSLTTRTPNRPFNSLDEMLTNGKYKLLVANNTAEYDYFAMSKDPTTEQAFNKLILTVPEKHAMRSVRGALQTVCTERNYAIFGTEAVLSIRIKYAENLTCSVISMARPMSSVYLGMALPKCHNLHGLINFHLKSMVERGIMERIKRQAWPHKNDQMNDVWKQVSPEEVYQIFALLVIGAATAVFILILEILWWNRNFYKKRSHFKFIALGKCKGAITVGAATRGPKLRAGPRRRSVLEQAKSLNGM